MFVGLPPGSPATSLTGHPHRSDRCLRRGAARSSSACLLAPKRRQQIGDSAGEENLTVMADLSNPSHMMANEEFRMEYSKEFDLAVENLLLSCFRQTDQGIIKIKELQQPSTIDILKEMQSSGNLSDALSGFVNFRLKSLIDKEDRSDSILVNPESVIKKPTKDIIDPCNNLSNCDVVGQETSRPSLAEIVDPKSPSTLGGNKTRAKVPVVSTPV